MSEFGEDPTKSLETFETSLTICQTGNALVDANCSGAAKDSSAGRSSSASYSRKKNAADHVCFTAIPIHASRAASQSGD
jgi:hypothetical protein